MKEILEGTGPGAYVLDLGSGRGSFDPGSLKGIAVAADLEFPGGPRSSGLRVQADAACLPFKDRVFTTVLCNHSVEHFENLREALCEITRVLEPSGALYITVPDATTFTDRLYRWLARGGGHVNAFRSWEEVVKLVRDVTGLPHRSTRTLYTSFSFLNRHNRLSRAPRKLLLLGGGAEPVLILLTFLLRQADRLFGTRAAVYGWAFYFGRELPLETAARTNVCVRCGSGHSSSWLLGLGAVRPFLGLRYYRCPACGAANLFTPDTS